MRVPTWTWKELDTMKIFSTSKSKKASTPDTIGSSDVTENGKQKSSGSLRSVSKRLSKSFQRAGEMITGIGKYVMYVEGVVWFPREIA